MKSRLILATCIGIAVVACNKSSQEVTLKPYVQPHAATTAYRLPLGIQETEFSKFIPIDSANKMISSYLYSINSTNNDTDVRSYTINADSLRSYLANSDVKNIKLIFAHSLNYINAGNNGVYSGFQSGALTIIIAGYDNSGNYIYHGGAVLDHGAPCPFTCPSGMAGSDYLQ